MNKRLAVLSIILLSAFAGWFFLVRNPGTQENIWLGYVEGEPLYIAAPVSGNLAERTVERGAPVKEGDRLFTLNAIITDADTARLQAELDAAQAEMADLQKQRQRPPELAVSRARQAAARAEVVRTDKQYERISILADKGFATKTQLDSVKAAADVARANLAQTLAEEQSGQLTSGRVDQVRAAAAKIASAEAALKAQRERRNEIAPTAPAAGIIEQTFYNPGEWVPANSPILSILPDDRRKLRFFVPEEKVATLKVGSTIRFHCDGCKGTQSATIRYIAPRAEFTPPVIYSEGARSKLVFMVEAALADSAKPLPLGLPVDVLSQ